LILTIIHAYSQVIQSACDICRPSRGLHLDYLHQPPAPAAVIVLKDNGGIVSKYTAQTARYKAESREVQLLECRSACTLALSLPKVCVYPWSVLKFHAATNRYTGGIDPIVTGVLMDAYPAKVRHYLGTLTPDFRVLTGAELIGLGIRDCRTPLPQHQRTAQKR